MTAPNIELAGAYNFNITPQLHLLAEANLHLSFDGRRNTLVSSNVLNIDPNIGLEASYNNWLFLRGGLSNFQKALSDGDLTNQKKVWIYQPSLGVGFKVGNLGVDYAFANLANQSNPLYTNVFSLRLNLVKWENNTAKPKRFNSNIRYRNNRL